MNNRGFTIIELVLVIIVAAIIAAVAVPKFAQYYGGITQGNAAIKIASDIRYAQNRATTTQQRTRVTFSGTYTYNIKSCSVADYNTTTCKCPDPTDSNWITAINPYSSGNFSIDINCSNCGSRFPGVSYTTGVTWLEFDALGRPYVNTSCSTPVAANTTINVQYSGLSNKVITIQAQTGMVSVN